ncbi:MAG: nucleotidyltransferase domain-containing protein [Actinoplanes sp.]
MQLSDPMGAVVPSLEGQVLRVLAATTKPLATSAIIRLVQRGSGPGVRVALRRLTGVGTVINERVGNQHQYQANRDHAAWPAIQAAVDFATGFQGQLDAKISRTVRDGLAGRLERSVTCAVFGSLARGTADARSDVDLVLVVPDDTPADTAETLSDRLTEHIAAFTGNPVNVLLLTAGQRDDMIQRDDPLVHSWRSDARTVHGPDLLSPSGET